MMPVAHTPEGWGVRAGHLFLGTVDTISEIMIFSKVVQILIFCHFAEDHNFSTVLCRVVTALAGNVGGNRRIQELKNGHHILPRMLEYWKPRILRRNPIVASLLA